MQGNPLRELILVLVLAALLVPVILRLTSDRAPAVADAGPVEVAQPVELTPTTIRMQFAHAPKEVVVKHAEDSTLRFDVSGRDTSIGTELQMDLSDRALEMPVTVTWPEGTPRTAVTITIEPDGLDAREVTFWSEGELNEWIEVNWDE